MISIVFFVCKMCSLGIIWLAKIFFMLMFMMKIRSSMKKLVRFKLIYINYIKKVSFCSLVGKMIFFMEIFRSYRSMVWINWKISSTFSWSTSFNSRLFSIESVINLTEVPNDFSFLKDDNADKTKTEKSYSLTDMTPKADFRKEKEREREEETNFIYVVS